MNKGIDRLVREIRACFWPCGMILATCVASALYYTFLVS